MSELGYATLDANRIVIPPEDALGEEQATAAKEKVRPWTNDHPVNIRLSVPFIFARFYLVVVAGKERRSAERRASERLKHPLLTCGNVIFLGALSTCLGLASLALLHFAGLQLLDESGLLLRP